MSQPELPAPTTSTRRPRRMSGVLYSRRMQRQAGELARQLGNPRIPMVAVGDHHAGILPHFAAGQSHRPTAAGRLDPLDRAVQLDHLVKPEVPRVRSQIFPGLDVAGILGIVGRHGEVGEFGQPLRRDQMGRLIDAAGLLPVVPIAADVVGALDHVAIDAGLTRNSWPPSIPTDRHPQRNTAQSVRSMLKSLLKGGGVSGSGDSIVDDRVAHGRLLPHAVPRALALTFDRAMIAVGEPACETVPCRRGAVSPGRANYRQGTKKSMPTPPRLLELWRPGAERQIKKTARVMARSANFW